jgi:hypothetical protein
MDDMEEQTASRPTVTRTYRAAVRIGEDFFTLEETITLPLDANDETIQQAADLGWRIYQAQHAALQDQIASLREVQGPPAPVTIRDPDAPASEKQRNYIAALQQDLHWSDEQITSYAQEQGIHLIDLRRGQASAFIDGLKRLAEQRAPYEASADSESRPITERQHQALLKLAQERGTDLETEIQRQFGVAPGAISSQQASDLIKAWQRALRGSDQPG